MEMPETEPTATKRPVWNSGRTVGAKRALKPKQIWEIRFYLIQRRCLRDRALFDLAIDSKLRGCDLAQMKIRDLFSGGHARELRVADLTNPMWKKVVVEPRYRCLIPITHFANPDGTRARRSGPRSR